MAVKSANMEKPSLMRRIYPSYLLVILFSMIPTFWYANQLIEDLAEESTITDLRSQAVILGQQLEGKLRQMPQSARQPLVKRASEALGARITLIAASGEVLADSDENPVRMDNHADRPEIREASDKMIGVSRRFSKTLGKRMIYVAYPVRHDQELLGFVRASKPVAELTDVVRGLGVKIAVAALICTLLAAGISYYVAYRINRPMAEMKKGAEKFASGDLSYRLEVPRTDEMAVLAEALNTMADRLKDIIGAEKQRSNELQTVFSNMVEGVIVFDRDGRVTKMNEAAGALFDVDVSSAEGRLILELIRHTELASLVSTTLKTGRPVQSDLRFIDEKDRYFQVNAAPIAVFDGNPAGGLLVLEEVTRLKEVEKIRRDFVTNASHELRTPAAAIKGFVETLLDGALQDRSQAGKFLEAVLRNTDRLTAIVEDLVTFSSVELNAEEKKIRSARTSPANLMEECADNIRKTFPHEDIRIQVDCPAEIQVNVDKRLISQAIERLLENAVHASKPGGEILLKCFSTENAAMIQVIDHGTGIEREHLDRIFERFYRKDKSRSRATGGAGLGLAIVKHAVKAHGGRIDVESAPGKGSIFTISLPLPAGNRIA